MLQTRDLNEQTNRSLWSALVVGVFPLLLTSAGWAQQSDNGADMLVVNARIVTVDNDDFTESLGTIAQAMSVKGGKLLEVGTNDQIRAGAGPNTQVYDLKGRTVLPGLVVVHEHPNDWDPVSPAQLKEVFKDDSKIIFRWIEGSPAEQIRKFPEMLKQAVAKAEPGKWIYFVFSLGDRYQYSTGGNGGFGAPNVNVLDGKLIPKALLEEIAPNNPVVLRNVFTGMLINDRAWEESKKVLPWSEVTKDMNEFGNGSGFRWMFSEVIMRDFYPEYRELARLGQSFWAGYGMTTYASECYNPSCVKVYSDLADSGQKAIRTGWKWNWRQRSFYDDPYFTNFMVWAEGKGNDYWWYMGSRPVVRSGSGCTDYELRATFRDRASKEELERMQNARQNCAWAPGKPDRENLYRYIRAGGRFINVHSVADKDIDYMMDIIEEASRDAGLTLEEIRAKRHGFDHTVMAPRPDQLERMKRLGMVTGGDAMEIFQAAPAILDIYGEVAVKHVVPKKMLSEAGIYNGFEVDRALVATDLTIFWVLARLMDRKAWDGQAYATGQAVGRGLALKSATAFGAYYLMKEKELGSLEAGKLADFIVLDRDYVTIPESDIENTRILMTVVGGQVVHLVPPLAGELGLEPVGAQYETGFWQEKNGSR